jgi:D-arabinono-1,4-lactone oxidase
MAETMESILVNGATYWLPADENDVITLVNRAKAENKTICMRGAAHSFLLINTLEAQAANGKNIYLLLSKMNKVTIDKPNMMVKVEAGCHLGEDPFDPSGISTPENSLLYQLDQQGMAVGDLGGITHQTIGGFMSTGSSGGSTQFAFEDALMSVDVIICGTNGAQKVTYTRPSPDNPNDPFYAVAYAGIGLMGVIISATFKCIPNFNIQGSETIASDNVRDKDCLIDLFGDGSNGKPSFKTFLEQTQYTRIIWWPQDLVTKAVVWQASRVPYGSNPDNLPTYHEVPYVGNSPIPASLAAELIYTAMGQWPNWLGDMVGTNSKTYNDIKFLVEPAFKPIIFPAICSVFVAKGVQKFNDKWYTGLPMDNQMGDKIMPVWFTELWITIDQSQAVMNELKNFYSGEKCIERTGIFCVEIYAAKKSPFWMSPAYEADVIRIDIFWYAYSNGDPVAYYQQFWDLLRKYNFRPHWGKYMPDGSNPAWSGYLKSVYPRWDDWMNLRAKNDPNNIFVSDYWKKKLEITDPPPPRVVMDEDIPKPAPGNNNTGISFIVSAFKKLIKILSGK